MNIGIAGAGIIGRLIALELLNQGQQVTLFDLGDPQGQHSCSAAATGMLAPFAELEQAEPLINQLGLDSLQLWPEILRKLIQPVFFQQAGSILVAHANDAAEMARIQQIFTKKFVSQLPMQLLDRENLKKLEPELNNNFQQGFYFANEGQLAANELIASLANTLTAQSIMWKTHTEVTAVYPGEIKTKERSYQFDWAIDCRGLGAADQITQLYSVRGELIYLFAPSVKIQRPIRLLHPRYPLYCVPRPHQHYILGASSIECHDLSTISVQTTLELLSAAYCLHSGFAEARIIKTVTHCRPTLPNHLPKMIYQPGLIRVNGLYRHGYLIAPALAAESIRLLTIGPAATIYKEILEVQPC